MTPINPLQTEPGTRLSWVGGGEGATERKNPLRAVGLPTCLTLRASVDLAA